MKVNILIILLLFSTIFYSCNSFSTPYIIIYGSDSCPSCKDMVDFFANNNFSFSFYDLSNSTYELRFKFLVYCGFPQIIPLIMAFNGSSLLFFEFGKDTNNSFWRSPVSINGGIPVYISGALSGYAIIRNYSAFYSIMCPEYIMKINDSFKPIFKNLSEIETYVNKVKNGEIEKPIIYTPISSDKEETHYRWNDLFESLLFVLSLLILTVSLAILDSINPCVMSIYVFLLYYSRDRKRCLSFIASVYIAYFLFGLGILRLMIFLNLNIFGLLIVVLGIYGLISSRSREDRCNENCMISRLYNKLTESSIVFVFLLGLILSFVLLPCTSGPYLVYIISLKKYIESEIFIALMLMLYDFIFVIPLILLWFGSERIKNTFERYIAMMSMEHKKIKVIIDAFLVILGLIILFIF